jgi:hypothetical protein
MARKARKKSAAKAKKKPAAVTKKKRKTKRKTAARNKLAARKKPARKAKPKNKPKPKGVIANIVADFKAVVATLTDAERLHQKLEPRGSPESES